MAAKWGLFLCDCRRTLPLDPQKLVLPVGPSILTNATDPDHDVGAFAAAVQRERPDRVLISCCADPGVFSKALDPAQKQSPKLLFVNLKEGCFSVHTNPIEAHAKATRLLRAAVASAETKETPTFNRLKVGTRLLIAMDTLVGQKLAEQLSDVAQPIFVVPRGAFDPAPTGEVYTGKIEEIKGRLGDFRVTVEDSEPSVRPRRELQADQVVIISHGDGFLFKPRTGLHILYPGAAEVDRVAARVRELIGEFLKPVHVSYQADICAGGSADQEACGICITACPYDAIGRDPENHLRMRVDHMACEGCGACVSACPTSSLHFTEPSPRELYARMAALLADVRDQDGAQALTLLFHCGEQGRRVLDAAGERSLPYPATVLPIEVPCLRYVSEANMLAAFHLGAAGVGLLGCESCVHGERELLYQKLDFCKLTLDAFALGAERLRLITAEDGGEAEAVAALARYAASLMPTPIHWDGKPLRPWGNREVIEDTLRSFIEQLGREPGRRSLERFFPFAFPEVNESGCTMCRSCVNVCPTHAFKLDEKAQALELKHMACVACGLCEKVCPEHVITLRPEIYFDKGALDHQTAVQDSMVSCAKCGKPYINRKALETVEARIFSLESLFDTFSGNRRNLLRMCPDCRAVDAMMEVEKGWKP
jgi:ferredoxin